MPLINPSISGAGSGDIVQTASAVLAADATTTSTTYVDLLSLNITTFGGTSLEVYASFSVSNVIGNSGAGQDFVRIVLDGVKLQEGGSAQWQVSETGMLCFKTDVVAAESHTVKIQWHTQAERELRCSASSLTRPEHASLVVVEVSR